ncbi:MAG: phage tail protein [Bacteroidia bacterium]
MLNNYELGIKNYVQRTTLLLVLLSIWSLSGAEAQAQNNVGIGTTTPNNKAVLELQSTNKGFLAPRMNTSFMNAIAPTATESALLIYNTDSACYHFYNGTAWKNLCQTGIDTATINNAIKSYLSGVNVTTVINNMLVDSSVTNFATINNAIINNITIDSSVINYTTINNAVINNLTVDSSVINYTTINNAIINNLVVDSSITNYANINNAVIDSLQSNYINATTGNFTTLNVGGQSINNLMTDSIKSQAWLLKGNTATNANTHFMGTTDNTSLRIRTNNTERMIVDSLGNVGIGTTMPGVKLHVKDGGSNLMFTELPQVTVLQNDAGTSNALISTFTTAGNSTLALNLQGVANWNLSAMRYANRLDIGTSGGADSVTSKIVTLLANGNVGIGTTTPTEKLDINGSIKIVDGTQGADKLLTSDATGKASWKTVGQATTNTAIYRYGGVIDLTAYDTSKYYPVAFAPEAAWQALKIEFIRSDTHEDDAFNDPMIFTGTLHFEGTFRPYGWGNTSGQNYYTHFEDGYNGVPQLSYVSRSAYSNSIVFYFKGGRHYYYKSGGPIQNGGGIGSDYAEFCGLVFEIANNYSSAPWHNGGPMCGPGNVYANVAYPEVLEKQGFAIEGGSIKIVDGTQGAGKVLTSDATGKASWQAGSGTPAGMISTFAGTVLPAGYFACNGAAVSRTTYANLFAAIGTTYGAGDGSTTFNLPNVPTDYTLVQAASNVGTQTTGQVISHTHTFAAQNWGGTVLPPNGVSANGSGLDGDLDGSTTVTGYDKVSVSLVLNNTGAAANYPSGLRITYCIKF